MSLSYTLVGADSRVAQASPNRSQPSHNTAKSMTSHNIFKISDNDDALFFSMFISAAKRDV